MAMAIGLCKHKLHISCFTHIKIKPARNNNLSILKWSGRHFEFANWVLWYVAPSFNYATLYYASKQAGIACTLAFRQHAFILSCARWRVKTHIMHPFAHLCPISGTIFMWTLVIHLPSNQHVLFRCRKVCNTLTLHVSQDLLSSYKKRTMSI